MQKIKANKTHSRAFIALILALLLILSQSSAVFAVETATNLTRGQARDIIFAAASKYNDGLKPTDIMSGYSDGSLKENQAVTRLEALVMISRAFGKLPKPGNDWERATSEEKYENAPKWAENEFANLYAGRILAPKQDGALNVEITAKQLDTLLKRVYALYGTRLEDDFYTYVNKEWLDKSTIPENDVSDSWFKMAETTAADHVDEIMKSLLDGKWEKGTTERKVLDVYNAYLDVNAKTKAGATPLKPFLDKLSAVKDMKDLENALAEIADGAAYFPLFMFEFSPDYKDSTQNAIYFGVNTPQIIMADNSEKTMIDYATRLFELAGYPNAKEAAKVAIKIENLLMDAQLNAVVSNSLNIEEHFLRLTIADFQKMFTGTDIKKLLTSGGLKESKVYILPTSSEDTLKELANLLTAENVVDLSSYSAYKLLDNYHMSMGTDFERAYYYYSTSEEELREYTPEQEAYFAQLQIKELFTGYISDVYTERYFSKEAKTYVENMIKTFIENYKARINNLDWMSGVTKEKALKKLDTMIVKVGWIDEAETFTKDLEIVSIEDGGSLLGNLLEIGRRKLAINIEKQGKPVDRNEWDMNAYTVNAQYSPLKNTITFPAAILQAPFFSLDYKPEQNLSAIGATIAHEITHAFDTSGAQFDETGKTFNWWTDEDKAKFNKLCEGVINHYDGAEVAPGFETIGYNTQGENIADLGGLSCALEALKKTVKNPDYALFFTNYAKADRYTADYEELEGKANSDPHSNGRVRANKAIQNFAEFYEAFDIKPGDGMYVAPENRVKVW